jgi:nucleoside-diphosphate-sugar epimerase
MSPIEKGSTVLVTGANGFIASHIVDQLLQLDYKVRGTVRTEAKGKWVQDFFDNKYGKGKLELVVVPAMEVKGAFDNAVKGQHLLMFLQDTLLMLSRLRGRRSRRYQHLLFQESQ